MRIVSLNAWGGAMFDDLARWLRGVDVDVLCLQEVTRTRWLGGWTSFDDTERQLPQRANLFGDVAGLLPRHQGSYVVSDIGPIVADGETHAQDFGVAMFVEDGLAVVGQTAAFVHGRFTVYETWATSDRPRVAQGVRVIDRSAGRSVVVVQLHGLRDASGKMDTPDRRRQAERLARLVEGIREDGDLVVVCGDFNLLPGSETFEVLAGIGLVDLVGAADTRTSRYVKPIRHANYLLVSDPAAVEHFEILTTPEVSDHRPLIVDV